MILITKKKYYNKQKKIITKKYINIYIVKKTKKISFIIMKIEIM